MRNIFKLLLLLCLSLPVLAQNQVNTPYSRFGLGELQSQISPAYAGMGGVGIGVYNPLSINVNNPASYTSGYAQRFMMQTGGAHTTNRMQTAEQSQVTNFTNISHFMIGFPTAKWWGTSIGLLPYSQKAYSFTDRDELNAADFSFEGEGGLSRFYIGNAFKLHKSVSIGANINYLFGSLTTHRKVLFDDASFLNARHSEQMYVSGFTYDIGAMFNFELKDWKAHLGLTYDKGNEVNAENDIFSETFRINSSGLEAVEDTFYNSSLDGVLNMPSSYGVGFSLKNKQWLLAGEYAAKNWSDYRAFGQSDSLANSSRMAFGAEFTPDKKAINKYWKMVRYRLGAYSSTTYLQLKGHQLNEQAITLGLGLPLKRSGTLLNLSAELGQRGTVEDGLIKDNFARFKIGLVLSDVWFIKRKFD
jgi:hypothetical protein